MKAKKFENKKEALKYRDECLNKQNSCRFKVFKFVNKRKYQFFVGSSTDWLLAIS